MKVAIASDHGGLFLKDQVMSIFKEKVEFKDMGTHSEQSCDYTDFAVPACEEVLSGNAELAILICGTGLGMSMSANKIDGIRAACVSEPFSARMARAHNNANVLCIGGRVIGVEIAKMIVEEFIKTEFEGGRHQRRVDKIMQLEKRNTHE